MLRYATTRADRSTPQPAGATTAKETS